MKFEDVIKNIEKKFGKEAIVGSKIDVEFVHSGSIGLDIAMGGGYAKGRITELFGWESSGKSTLALHLAAEVQKLGKKVGYIDMENALDVEYAKNLGVSVDFKNDFFLSQPDDGETGLGILLEMCASEDFGLVVFDSIGAILPKTVTQGEVGDSKMGVVARLLSQELPKVAQYSKKSGCIVLFINQLREKIGVVYGNPETTMGGHAMKFAASQRLQISRCGQEKDGDEITANKTKVKVVKNKVAVPFKVCEFNIEFGTGIDKFSELIDIAVDYSIIDKRGSWYSYGEVKLGQGIVGVRNILQDNPELMEEIKSKVFETIM